MFSICSTIDECGRNHIGEHWMPDYFGFKSGSDRSTIAGYYALQKGATQDEIDEKGIGGTLGHYRMLGQAKKWGHKVWTWDDPRRPGTKVFKLEYDPKHSARGAAPPPLNWQQMNIPTTPPGVTATLWDGKSI
jgi:hypothetical protein